MKKREINVLDFVEGYNKNATDNLKEKYLKDKLQINSYVPFNTKVVISRLIVRKTMTETVRDEKGNVDELKSGKFMMDSPARYLFWCRQLIDQYTNLTTHNDTWLEEYDALKSSGLLDDFIQNKIPQSEILEYQTILKMVVDDEIQNKYEIHRYIDEKIEDIKLIIGEMVGNGKIDELISVFNTEG